MKEKHYYIVKIRWGGGWHLIKAFSKEDALRIREKFGIGYPWGTTEIEWIVCERIDRRRRLWKDTIERRKKGQGGSIWYEDENGNLQTEK